MTSKPSSDSDIKIEYWLPVNGWNGNFEANGNGGWSGSITANTLATGMQRGYAAAMPIRGTTAAAPVSRRGIRKR